MRESSYINIIEERYSFIFVFERVSVVIASKNVIFGVLMGVENCFVSNCRTDNALNFSWFFLFYPVCDI